MKNSFRDRVPLTIETHEEMRKLWAEFKNYMRKAGYVSQNQNTRLTGAALFVDFLCVKGWILDWERGKQASWTPVTD